MKTAIQSLTAIALASTLAAQGGLATSSGYAVFANAGTGNVQGVPAGTAIGPAGLAIRVADGAAGTAVAAHASTRVDLLSISSGTARGAAVAVAESGAALARSTTRVSAGTSDNPRTGNPAAHGLRWHVPASAGDVGVVVVNWAASATSGAIAAASVDVDGDGSADFADRVSGGRNQLSQTFRVRAGSRGFVIGITTLGHAGGNSASSLAGNSYDSKLSVALRVEPVGPTCTFTAFGPECAGKLAGSNLSTSAGGVGLRLANAAPNAIAVLVIGDQIRPLPLPGSRCALLVNPRGLAPTQTDANGSAGWAFPIRLASAMSVDFQAVILDLRGGAPSLGSSNGVNLTCQ